MTSKESAREPCLGERFLIAFSKLLQAVRIHQDNNALVIKGAKDFIRSMIGLTANEDELRIEMAQGRFHIQDKKILNRRETAAIICNLMGYFERLGLSGLHLTSAMGKDPIKEILAFARLLNQAEEQKEPMEWLRFNLEEKGYWWVGILHKHERQNEEIYSKGKDMARKVYSYAYHSIHEVTDKISSGKRVGIQKTLRIIQNLADLVIDDDPVLLGLCTIRDYDDYTYTHSVNVAILSMCLGQQIGLSRKSLVRLGICGLFHDLGKIDIAIGIINKPGKLTDEEFKEVQKHSTNSVRQILKLQAFKDLKSQIVLPPFEHHLKYDLSGYPSVNWNKPISLFGRILAITDVYDALSSARVYRPTALSPDRVLGMMLEKSGTDFDPVLLKWFINMLGVYPVGTLLELDDGKMGLVVKSTEEPDPARPEIMLLKPDGKRGVKKGVVVKLSERDPQSGEYVRNVFQSHHPSSMGIQPAELLI